MISIPGIKSILKCTKGTLATTPTNPIHAGLRDKATMTFKPYKASKEHKGRQFRNMIQAMVEYESKQPTLKHFKANIDLMNLNADYQIMSEKQSFTADSEDVFKFTASTFLLGHGFEYLVTLEKRVIKETLKGGADYDVVKNLIDAGDSETAVVIAGVTHPGGEDWTLQRRSNILLLQSPAGTNLIEKGEFEEVEFSIKSKDSENGEGQITVDGFVCRLKVTGKDASVTKLVAQLNKNINSSVLFKIANSGSYYDLWDFAAGTIVPIEEPELSDDKRNLTVTYEGEVRPYEIDLQTGATKGGALSDGGLNGGTVAVGY